MIARLVDEMMRSILQEDDGGFNLERSSDQDDEVVSEVVQKKEEPTVYLCLSHSKLSLHQFKDESICHTFTGICTATTHSTYSLTSV